MKSSPLLVILFLFHFVPMSMLSLEVHAEEGANKAGGADIEKEIMSHTQSSSVVIENSRNLLIDSVSNNDFGKANEVIDYLDKQFANKEVVYLWIWERSLFNYIRGDFNRVISDVKSYVPYDKFQLMAGPKMDSLFLSIRQAAANRKSDIESNINASDVGVVDRQFLLLFFDALIARNKNVDISQDEINRRSAEFLNLSNAERIYGKFVNSNIRYEFRPSDFSFGVGFFTGMGQYMGNLRQNFSSGVPFGMKGDIRYDRLNLFFKLYTESIPVKRDFNYKGDAWASGADSFIEMPQLLFGYSIFNSDKVTVTPYGGFAFPRYGVRSDQGTSLETQRKTSGAIGVVSEYQFYRYTNDAGTRGTNVTLFLDVSYIQSAFKNHDDPFYGDIIIVTFGIGGRTYSLERIR